VRFRIAGPSGLRVSDIALGTETFGDSASAEESRKILDLYYELGGNVLDTAAGYADGRGEEIIGELLGTRRDEVIISTKYGAALSAADPNATGNHRRCMVRSVERSLRRLRTDWIDLLWLHIWDGTVPVEEVLRAMDDLVRSGKVLHVGLSDTPAWVASEAVAVARLRGWAAPTAIQAPYNFASRDAERDLLPMAAAHGMPMFAWGVLGGGLLTGKYLHPQDAARRYGEMDPGGRARLLSEAIVSAAREVSATPAQTALAWIAGGRWSAHVIPIVGVRSADQLAENLARLPAPLPREVVERLDSVVDFKPGFPNEFLRSDDVRKLVSGGFAERIDLPAGPYVWSDDQS
jgi:aryl-alcohol dehydrogenase-like predicted oxidoreductase